MLTDYGDTPHVKASQTKTPTKANHKHEYIRPFYMNYIRRFDGSVSEKKHKFDLPVECVECGAVKKRARTGTYTEVEVSVREGHKMRDERK